MTNYNMNSAQKRRIKEKMKGKPCGICGKPINGLLTIDHIIPKAKGGTNAQSNLQPAHFKCNQHKSNGLAMVYRIFVYGTLRKGCIRNNALKEAKYLGETTVNGLKLFWYRYPVIRQTFDFKDVVRGDLYEINERTKTLLDGIENPAGYSMELVDEQRGIYCYVQKLDWQDNAYPMPLNDAGEQEYNAHAERNIYEILGLKDVKQGQENRA